MDSRLRRTAFAVFLAAMLGAAAAALIFSGAAAADPSTAGAPDPNSAPATRPTVDAVRVGAVDDAGGDDPVGHLRRRQHVGDRRWLDEPNVRRLHRAGGAVHRADHRGRRRRPARRATRSALPGPARALSDPNAFPGTGPCPAGWSFGCLWDTKNYDVSSTFASGDASANATIASRPGLRHVGGAGHCDRPVRGVRERGLRRRAAWDCATRAPGRSPSAESRQARTSRGRTCSGRTSTRRIRAAR